MLQRRHQVWANILFAIAATDRKNKYHILGLQAARLEPLNKDTRPTLIVRSRCQLGYIIRRRVRFDLSELAKIIDRVRTIRRAAAHA